MTFVTTSGRYLIVSALAGVDNFDGLAPPHFSMAETPNRLDRAELSRRMERAEKLLQKGKTLDALEEYLQILAADTENDTVRNMAADLCLSLQRTPEAVRLLGELFDHQVQAGDGTRASLTYKKLARYVNPTWEQKLSFGQLLENSNRKLAVETYENAFAELTSQARQPDSLIVLKRIVALDSKQQNFIRLGELSSELGDNKGAAAAFLQVAQLAEAAKENAAPWFERAYTEDPNDPDMALAYGKSLTAQGQVGAAIFVLEPHVSAGNPSPELRDTYAKTLIAANRLTEAEPLVWQMLEQNPQRVHEVANLIGLFIDGEQDAEAVALARKLEQFQRRRGERRSFVAMMQELAGAHRASPDVLEFMSELFNSSNREGDYCQTLLKLFDLHYSMGNYSKAADCLDRAIEVDAYEPGHQKRFEMLQGKVDDSRYKVIASRLSGMSTSVVQTAPTEPTLGAAALQDLMLQAEILVQYGMRSKAIERLQRIQELFPHEEDRNQDLQQLYLSAGMTPRYAGSVPVPQAPAASVAPPAAQAPAAPAASPAPEPTSDVTHFTRVAEITRKLYRQGNADAVLTVSAQEIGSQWKVTRCIAAMRKPGLPPTAAKEYGADGNKPATTSVLARVVTALQDLAIQKGAVTISDAPGAPELQSVREPISELGIHSLLALPLIDGPDHVGVLILMDNHSRGWHSSDIVVLKTISDQIVVALNNAGLRRLVKNLSVTDEQSGLLKRQSYLDLLMAETHRAIQQSTPITLLLMQFGKHMVKEIGTAAAEAIMRQVGQLFAANIRQNDLAFRYDTATVALVLGETGEKEALLAVEKLRKLLSGVHMPESQDPVPINVGLAEAVVRAQFDAVDIVTEVINRGELALDMAIAQGTGKPVVLAALQSSAAVA
ncbi:MAG TPA: CDC27 family protein [Terriglobales bacterium]|jgi:diguanylate cyclase (GGDEF)-like protein